MGYYDYVIRRTLDSIMTEYLADKGALFLEINDGIYKFQQSVRGWDMAPVAGVLSLLSLIFLFKINDWVCIIGLLLVNLLALLTLVYAFWVPPRILILDRLNNKITFLKRRRKKSVTFKFSGGETSVGYTEGIRKVLILREKGNRRYSGIVSEVIPEDAWARYVWFMDKNRPLPPGTAFDPYREKDFQRRKAEGFPPPLYPSLVPTPEATPKQQKEREKYWKG